MGTRIVKSVGELAIANKGIIHRYNNAGKRIIGRMAGINYKESIRIAEEHRFQGVLISKIDLQSKFGGYRFDIISSAPHSKGIEEGIPPIRGGGWITFKENPLLETWVKKVLMKRGPEAEKKAKSFLRKKKVMIGKRGYPFPLMKGLRFMERGFNLAVSQVEMISMEELSRI